MLIVFTVGCRRERFFGDSGNRYLDQGLPPRKGGENFSENKFRKIVAKPKHYVIGYQNANDDTCL